MYLLFFLCSMLFTASLAQADVTKTLSWQPVTQTVNNQPLTNLSGYKVFQRKDGEPFGGPVATILAPTTQATVTMPDTPMDWHFAVTAFTPYAESQKSAELEYIIVAQLVRPCTPVLSVVPLSTTSLRVSWPACDDGTGNPAKLDLRWSVPPLNWGAQVNPTVPCPTSPCTIAGLAPDALYDVQGVAYRGEPNTASVVYGNLSAIASGRTQAASVPPPIPPTEPTPVPVPAAKTIVTTETITVTSSKTKLRVTKDQCPGGFTSTGVKSYNSNGDPVTSTDKTWAVKELETTCKP